MDAETQTAQTAVDETVAIPRRKKQFPVQIGLSVTEKMYDDLKKIAVSNNCPIQSLIREYIAFSMLWEK